MSVDIQKQNLDSFIIQQLNQVDEMKNSVNQVKKSI